MPPDIHHLKSFWLILVGLCGLFLSALFYVGFGALWGGAVGATAVGFALLGFFFPHMTLFPYRAWNALARVFGRNVTQVLLFLCYSIIHVGVGRKQSDLLPVEISRYHSLWRMQEGNSWPNRLSGFPGTSMSLNQGSWNVQFVRWTMASGNWWMCSLLPCMVLIRLLAEDETSHVVSGNVYTLY